MKLLDGTIGKFMATAAGIEGRPGLPVAKQSPPQYGRSFAETDISKLLLRLRDHWAKLTSRND